MDTTTRKSKPGLWELFVTWLLLGIQSFGGGSSTFLLIHQACITRHWLNEEEFTRSWALAQIAPGINLVKLTAMIGYRLRGWARFAGGNVWPLTAQRAGDGADDRRVCHYPQPNR